MQHPPAVRRFHQHGLWVVERAAPGHDFDVVALERALDGVTLALDDAADVRHQLGHRWTRGDGAARGFDSRARIDATHGFAKRLRGNRARLDTHAADALLPLDDGDALAKLCGLDGRPLAGGSAPDADQIVAP